MPKQHALSLQIPIIPDQLEALEKVLDGVGNPSAGDGIFPFSKLPEVHFARWIIAPAATLTTGRKVGASLVYAGNVDGSADQHVQRIVDTIPEGLDAILCHCVGYPEEGNRNAASRIAYIRKHTIKTPGFYVGAPERSVQQIYHEAELQVELRKFIESKKGQWKTHKEAYRAIKDFVKDDPKWDWARQPFKVPKTNIPMAILVVLMVLVLSPFLIIMLLCLHFFYEMRLKPFGLDINQVPDDHFMKMKSQEDVIYQNQLSQVFETKKGLPRFALKFFLLVTNLLAKYVYVGGQLMGTPTIHFARWVMIDGGDRYVFFSNFDGSWDMYLGDFVDNGAWGLNAVYSASVGYPTTLFVFGKGAYNIDQFMGWGRYTQVKSQIWYCAYPWYGLPQIIDRSRLRTALFNKGELNEKEMHEMLRRI